MVPVVLVDSARRSRVGPARRPLYPICRAHLDALGDDIGLWQHARGAVPDKRFGYCTDDVARSMVVDVLHSRELTWAAVDDGIGRSLTFLEGAFDGGSGRFRNLRTAGGRWLDADASEDCHARALVGLAAVIGEIPDTRTADRADRLFELALPAAESFGQPRPISAALLACDSAIETGWPSEAYPTFERLAIRLVETFGGVATRPALVSARDDRLPTAGRGQIGQTGQRLVSEWPWPEPVLTYENALMPHSLIAAGRRLRQDDLVAGGCAMLDWLIEVQTGEEGVFSPVGNKGWWPRNGHRSQFDQQPIEAATLLAAAAAAFNTTGRPRYLDAAEAAYGWFLGDNDVGVAVADPARGACHDGLAPDGVNQNQGAESTLMWLTAVELMRELRRLIEPHAGNSAADSSTQGVASRRGDRRASLHHG